MSPTGEVVAIPAPGAPGAPGGTGPGRPVVRVRDLSKRYHRPDGSVTRALDGVSFDVHAGQLIVVVGPRGCGHTTLLHVIAGLEAPDDGRVEFNVGRRVSLISTRYPLPAQLTVLEIVVGPAALDRRRRGRSESVARARQTLAAVGVADRADRYPDELDAGQCQRVALARALMSDPDLVLFDGPLPPVGSGEPGARRGDLMAMPRSLGLATVFVTHERPESLDHVDRLAVMDRGRIAQFGAPHELYDRPSSRHVAACTGTTNELVGSVCGIDGMTGAVHIRTPLGPVTGRSGGPGLSVGDPAVALWRPERARLGAAEPLGPNRWPVTVEASLFLDAHSQHAAAAGGHRFLVWQHGGGARAGDGAWMTVDPAHVRVLPA